MSMGIRILTTFFVLLGLTLGVAPTAAADSAAPAVSPSTPGDVVSPVVTNGDLVVWAEDAGGSGSNADILGAHLSDGKVFTIAGGPANQTNPRIDGSVVIWTVLGATAELHALDLSVGNELLVVSLSNALPYNDVSGHTVVWVSGNQVLERDITTMDSPTTIGAAPNGWSLGPVAITGTTVAWVEQTANENHTHPWQIRVATIGETGSSIVASGVANTGAGIRLAASGNTLVYTAGGLFDPIYGQLYVASLSSFASTLITDDAAFPTTDGRYVCWQTHNGPEAPPAVHCYDLQSSSMFKPPVTALSNGQPDLANDALVWQTSSQQNLMIGSQIDIQIAYEWQVLPSGPRPNPNATSSGWLYFPETSHYLSLGFKTFWQQSGGLPVFGYPMTEEYSELNADLNQMMTVQYTERQRFEYHPDLAGTPYEVSLGRLGAEDAQHRNLVSTQAFQSLPATTQSDTSCEFFAATGHLVCGDFKAYWESHGLDFGDTGISFRESLALFGYPISEQFTDPQTGLVTQYFERAVFEYHPDNSSSYKVLLKRLGASALLQRGW